MSRKRKRQIIVAVVEDLIALIGGTAFVALVIWIAALLCKLWGVL